MPSWRNGRRAGLKHLWETVPVRVRRWVLKQKKRLLINLGAAFRLMAMKQNKFLVLLQVQSSIIKTSQYLPKPLRKQDFYCFFSYSLQSAQKIAGLSTPLNI